MVCGSPAVVPHPDLFPTRIHSTVQAHHAVVEERLGGKEGVLAKLADAMGALEEVSRKCDAVETSSKDAVHRLQDRFEQSQETQDDKDLMMEERFRSTVMEVSENSAEQHERLAKAVAAMTSRADQLAQTAQRLAIEQKLQADRAAAVQAKALAASQEQGKLVCSITDSHRREIDRVCRDAECGRLLESLVMQIEATELVVSESKQRERAHTDLSAKMLATATEIAADIVPKAVKNQVGDMVQLKVPFSVHCQPNILHLHVCFCMGTIWAHLVGWGSRLYGLGKPEPSHLTLRLWGRSLVLGRSRRPIIF